MEFRPRAVSYASPQMLKAKEKQEGQAAMEAMEKRMIDVMHGLGKKIEKNGGERKG